MKHFGQSCLATVANPLGGHLAGVEGGGKALAAAVT